MFVGVEPMASPGCRHRDDTRPLHLLIDPCSDCIKQSLNQMSFNAYSAAASDKPADLGQLKPGDSVSTDAAPQIAGKPFTISCTVTATPPEGILVAHGGTAVGYALHLRGGRVVFTIRDKGGECQVEAALPASGDPQRIVASLAAEGSLKLQIGDQPAVTAPGPGLLSRQPQEDFCLGHDNDRPLTTYATQAVFPGRSSSIGCNILRESQRFAHLPPVEQPTGQVATFDVGRAFTQQRDHFGLLSKLHS